MDPKLNDLFKWSIENTSPSSDPASTSHAHGQPPSQLNPEILQALMGGPSDADLMKESMAAIRNPEVDLENKLVAFDNFEQLIEGIDNANNMEALGLWTPLVELLENEEKELRTMAAWCVGTAVQNNVKAQERLHALGAIGKLSKMTTDETDDKTRRKAIYALSSAIRNYQPSLDVALKHFPEFETMDANDMEAVDKLINGLREKSAEKA